jgi:hypothetical protein
LKVERGPWVIGLIPQNDHAGKWTWVRTFNSPEQQSGAFRLQERVNHLWISPRSPNIKIDRIVLYQTGKRRKALDLATPASEFHP